SPSACTGRASATAQANTRTTVVRIAVARFGSTSATPTLASTAVSPAKSADRRAQGSQFTGRPPSGRLPAPGLPRPVELSQELRPEGRVAHVDVGGVTGQSRGRLPLGQRPPAAQVVDRRPDLPPQRPRHPRLAGPVDHQPGDALAAPLAVDP